MKCEDCGFEYSDGVSCPQCGYDPNVDLVQAVRTPNPCISNSHEEDFSKICSSVESGKIDQNKAREYWAVINNKAREGDRDARHLIGRVAMMKGEYDAAHKILSRLADAGHALAQLDLGKIHEEGLGTEKNIYNAIRLYRLSAAQGNPIALMMLANQHRDGGCLRTDNALANAIMEELVAVHPTMFKKQGGCGCNSCNSGDTDVEFAQKAASQITRFIKYGLILLTAAIVISIVWSELSH